ncbi:hypothetical protein J7J81_00410 [bacterium]|nr:hypothetical protein [bacterium]
MFVVATIKILIVSTTAFLLSLFLAPLLIKFLYRYHLWRKVNKRKTIDGREAAVFNKLNEKREKGVPRLGGLLIWLVTVFSAFLFSGLSVVASHLFNDDSLVFWFRKLNFLSRDQTWLPLALLVAASFLGLLDDILQIFGKGKYAGGGLRFTRRLIAMVFIGLLGGWWFYSKLGWHTLHIPGIGDLNIGVLYIPLFVTAVLGSWAGGVIDGIDGLAAGSFSIMFAAFGVIAFSKFQFNLATLCGVLTGTLLAFLWYNAPPAKFYMGESGMMGLTTSLAVIAFLTDSAVVLPVIAGLLVIEVLSVILQLIWRRNFHRKLFLCAPIHHHLEAKGWSPTKITIRFWILGIIFAIVGVIYRLLG